MREVDALLTALTGKCLDTVDVNALGAPSKYDGTKEISLQLEVSFEEAQTIEALLERAFRDLLEETDAAEDEEKRRHLGRRAVLIKGLLSRIQTATV